VNKVIFLLLSILLFGEARYWNYEFEFELKKGEVKQFQVIDRAREKLLNFSWNLYINSGLITITNFDDFPYQNILYLDYNRNSFKKKLYRKNALLMIEFVEFLEKEKIARFRLFVKNSKVEEYKPNEVW
jgi:hypothetical protein